MHQLYVLISYLARQTFVHPQDVVAQKVSNPSVFLQPNLHTILILNNFFLYLSYYNISWIIVVRLLFRKIVLEEYILGGRGLEKRYICLLLKPPCDVLVGSPKNTGG